MDVPSFSCMCIELITPMPLVGEDELSDVRKAAYSRGSTTKIEVLRCSKFEPTVAIRVHFFKTELTPVSIQKDAIIVTSILRRAAAWVYCQVHPFILGGFRPSPPLRRRQESMSRHIHQKCAHSYFNPARLQIIIPFSFPGPLETPFVVRDGGNLPHPGPRRFCMTASYCTR